MTERVGQHAPEVDWTYEQFVERVGRAPMRDELGWVNCARSGADGHTHCGVCAHDRPMLLRTACAQCEMSGEMEGL